MATLTVWKFDSAGGAENALALLRRMQKEEVIQVNDAAYVYWPEGNKKPKTKQANDLTGAGALGGSFWGLLFGLIFFVPLLGMAVGAATGAATGALADVGVDDNFMKDLGAKLESGGAALIVLVRSSTRDKVLPEIAHFGGEVIQTSLDNEAEERLRHALEMREAAAV